MSEYIERGALMQAITAFFEPVNTAEQALMLNHTLKAINLLSTADVVEVKHERCPVCSGEKAIVQDFYIGASVEVDAERKEMLMFLDGECFGVFSIDYCPNCGADMRGEKNGE